MRGLHVVDGVYYEYIFKDADGNVVSTVDVREEVGDPDVYSHLVDVGLGAAFCAEATEKSVTAELERLGIIGGNLYYIYLCGKYTFSSARIDDEVTTLLRKFITAG